MPHVETYNYGSCGTDKSVNIELKLENQFPNITLTFKKRK